MKQFPDVVTYGRKSLPLETPAKSVNLRSYDSPAGPDRWEIIYERAEGGLPESCIIGPMTAVSAEAAAAYYCRVPIETVTHSGITAAIASQVGRKPLSGRSRD